MTIKQTRIAPPKIKICPICQKQFTYIKSNTIYCSNACKCKAYQSRVRNNENPSKKVVFFSTTPEKNDIDTKELAALVQEQKQYIEWLHKYIEKYNKEIRSTYDDLIEEYTQYIDDLNSRNESLIQVIKELIEDKKQGHISETLSDLVAKIVISKGVFK